MDNYVAIRIGGNLITWLRTPFLEFVHTKMLSILNIIQDSDMLQVDKQTQEKKKVPPAKFLQHKLPLNKKEDKLEVTDAFCCLFPLRRLHQERRPCNVRTVSRLPKTLNSLHTYWLLYACSCHWNLSVNSTNKRCNLLHDSQKTTLPSSYMFGNYTFPTSLC